ncbi:MAG: MOSC domain-containing protein [Clostridioides sp.]|jgi:MOSC domain-containing protein YiiM|nr:MOSC domain-containing protein [Clostridioides sp.]
MSYVGVVRAVCISERRGTKKKNVETGDFIEEYGIDGDAHAGNWHRQVSLLSFERIQDFKDRGADIGLGDFGENLVVEGFDFIKYPVGSRFKCNEVLLEITQIGKECHSHCEIYKSMGECIMPKQGVFARVIHGGKISVSDKMQIV